MFRAVIKTNVYDLICISISLLAVTHAYVENIENHGNKLHVRTTTCNINI